MQQMAMRSVLVVAVGLIVPAWSLEQNPVPRVVGLLHDLEAKVQADGEDEQKSYDKFACWCESTLAGKAKDISNAKEEIEKLGDLIVKLEGDLATHAQEIKQLEKDIAANEASQKEAKEVRDKERAEYSAERIESEQCIGALEAAINVLAGAGTGKKGFLETIQQAKVMSVVDGLREVLRQPTTTRSLKAADLVVVKHFVAHPDEFVGRHSSNLAAIEVGAKKNNPFGDYAPQSTQISGILKGMYDSFTSELEQANAEEADKQKAYEDLMGTKMMELKTLQTSHRRVKKAIADATKSLADSKQSRDETQAQLAADEEFFTQTKESCQVKATEWSQRARLRTEELAGIAQAIQILSDPENEKIFENATSTFLQTSQRSVNIASHGLSAVADRLNALSTQYSSLSLAKIAAKVQSSGHFDKAIEAIDEMIAILRKEEAEDISQRDYCQGKTNANKNEEEDLDHDITKSGDTISRLEDDAKAIRLKIKELEDEIKETKNSMDELKRMRLDEQSDLAASIKADTDGIELIEQAIAALSRFYEKKDTAMLQRRNSSKYEPMPETTWSGGDYGGRDGETKGIISILGMIKEDLEKEIKTGRAEDAESQKAYDADRAALYKTLRAQEKSLTTTEKQLAELELKINDIEEYKKQTEGDLKAEQLTGKALQEKCAWVATHFESRRTKRKAEMAGLNDAKAFLAGEE